MDPIENAQVWFKVIAVDAGLWMPELPNWYAELFLHFI